MTQAVLVERRDRSGGEASDEARRVSLDPGIFSPIVRRSAIAYVGGVVLVALAVGLSVHGEAPFLVAWCVFGLMCLAPAMGFTAVAARRSSGPHRRAWQLWGIGIAAAALVGVLILVSELWGTTWTRQSGGTVALACIPLCGASLVILLRSKSGRLLLSVDLLDVAMAVVLLSAPVMVFLVEALLTSPTAWFVVPCAIVGIALPASVYAAAVLFARLPRGHRLVEGLLIALGSASTVNAWLLVAQGLSGYTLPASPLLAVQVTDMGLILLLAVFAHSTPPAGLDRLAAHAQRRRHAVMPALVLIGVPLLFVEGVVWGNSVSWGVPVVMGSFAMLVLLATARHMLMVRETRRLYMALENVAEERRVLLSSLMRAVEDDRHRIAAQLHEQAVGSLAVLASVVHTSSAALPADVAAAVHAALAGVRADLGAQADVLRRLMLAVQAPALDDESLATALVVYHRELVGESTRPALLLDLDHELMLDWTTKTIVFRIAKEALHNVWCHAGATIVTVALHWTGDELVLEISDDGCGYDPAAVVFESGLATMQLFAGLGHGSLRVSSAPGHGTVVRASLGSGPDAAAPADPPPVRGRLRLVEVDGT